ncbi:hypothetical protein D9M68_961480 [compost metagenome]
MKMFFRGLSCTAQKWRTRRRMVSLASDPELTKKEWLRSPGASSASFAANAMVGSVVHWKKLL